MLTWETVKAKRQEACPALCTLKHHDQRIKMHVVSADLKTSRPGRLCSIVSGVNTLLVASRSADHRFEGRTPAHFQDPKS
jgi:hypothetical protein